MLAQLRAAAKIMAIASYTLPLMLYQEIALRTGWWSDRRVPRLWHRLTLRVLGIRVHLRGRPATEKPLLIVSNHVSWSDILVLGSIMEAHFIAKAEVRGWPLLGTFARMQRSVFIERERRRASSTQAREIANRLASGDPMVLFAEGTTGDGTRILPFKSALFGAAQIALGTMDAERVLVQPAAIAYIRRNGLPLDRRERGSIAWIGDMDFLPHLKELLRRGAIDVEVRFAEPISCAAGTDRKALARKSEVEVRRMVAAALRGREKTE
ncbi:lysophospholipid acyltransferase family protein [Chelativorans sp. Marseille-P2723]|uniref:lysophospholipid acyltransferase family protein n=1 Tax=Chelativorans sp. Marseille-P2723 TaxID=2709133 RepID=UPI001570C3E4|nr:lysophospholipid acyltransferase family protein [Chelativorans sp. Marseille-P2723]